MLVILTNTRESRATLQVVYDLKVSEYFHMAVQRPETWPLNIFFTAAVYCSLLAVSRKIHTTHLNSSEQRVGLLGVDRPVRHR